jgi:PAS domain S-box-containing protein
LEAVGGAGSDAAVHDTAERLRAVVNTAVEAIMTIDEKGILESFNPAAEKMFGYTAEEIIGRNVTMLMPAPYREQHDRYIQEYCRTGQAKIIGLGREVVGRRKDGTVFPMDLSVGEVHLSSGRLFTDRAGHHSPQAGRGSPPARARLHFDDSRNLWGTHRRWIGTVALSASTALASRPQDIPWPKCKERNSWTVLSCRNN